MTSTDAKSSSTQWKNDTVMTTTYSKELRLASSTSTENINLFYFYKVEQFTLLWTLFTIIVLGNLSVLVTLFFDRNPKSRMNFFINQLAIADLFVGILNVLTDIIWRITVSWRAGNIACKFIRYLQACVTYASTYVLVALSIDRYDAITHPMNFSRSWYRARRLVAAAWICSATFSAPMILLYEEKIIQYQTQCWIELKSPWHWQIYMSIIATILFIIPAIIIATCYVCIIRTIWSKGKNFEPKTRRNSRGIIPRAKVKTIKMTIVIVAVFIVCWSPYILFDLLQVYGQIPQTQSNIAIATFIQSLAPLNSAANPIIYCLFSTRLCRTFRCLRYFRWITNCNKTQDSPATNIVPNDVITMRSSTDSMRTLTTSLISRNKHSSVVVQCTSPIINE